MSAPDELVWVEGGAVPYSPTIPTEGGVTAVAAFALSCWRNNVQLLRASMVDADRLKAANAALVQCRKALRTRAA